MQAQRQSSPKLVFRSDGWRAVRALFWLTLALLAWNQGFAADRPATSDELIQCGIVSQVKPPPGETQFVEYRPHEPSFVLVRSWRDSDGKERVHQEWLLDGHSVCGVDYPDRIGVFCKLGQSFPDPQFPTLSRYYTAWECGSSVEDRVAGSISVSLHRPFSQFTCNVGDQGLGGSRQIFLSGCRVVSE